MKRRFVFLSVLFIIISNLSVYAVTQTQTLDGIAAVVNDHIITQSQVNTEINILTAQLKGSNQALPSTNDLRKQALKELINNQLLLEQAKTENITATDEQVDQVIKNIAAQNNMTAAQLYDAVAKQGLSKEQYIEQTRQGILLNSVVEKHFAGKITISKEEIAALLKAHPISEKPQTQYHIIGALIPVASNASPEVTQQAEKTANDIANQLQSGKSFTQVQVNSALGQTIQNGDLGWRTVAELPPPLVSSIVNAKKGAVIGPVQTPQGFYVFQYLDSKVVTSQHLANSYNYRRILFKETPLNNEQTIQARLNYIHEEMIKGMGFAELAKKYSQDEASAVKGGEMGWVNESQLSPQLAKYITQLKAGETSPPFQTNEGWEIIQLVANKQVDDTKTFYENQAKAYLYQKKLSAAINDWLEELKKTAFIKEQ